MIFPPFNGVMSKESGANPYDRVSKESGPCRDRTDDPQIKSLLLYRLS